MKCQIKINTKGIGNLTNALLSNKKAIRVGILGNDNSRNDGLSNATIGAMQEFGSENKKIPARSFLKMPITTKQEEIGRFAQKSLANSLKNNDIETSLNQIGLFSVGVIQGAFDTKGFGMWSPNAPMTIKLKKSSSPLIDTGELRRSISHDIINVK